MDVYNKYQKNHSTTPKSSISERMNFESDDHPYLIVDLRDRDDFNTNHIVSGNFTLK